MQPAYELTGRLTDARSVSLDEPLPLARGPVRVTVRALTPTVAKPHRETLAEVHALLAEAGHVPPAPVDVARRVADERGAWE
jgi:hypothetical protein